MDKITLDSITHFSLPTFPNPSLFHPNSHTFLSQLHVFSISYSNLKPTEPSSFCATHLCMGMGPSTGAQETSQGSHAIKQKDSPLGNHQLVIAPQTGVGCHETLLHPCWEVFGLAMHNSCVCHLSYPELLLAVLSGPANTVSPQTFIPTLWVLQPFCFLFHNDL